jgi:hypothetical protein
MLNRQFPPQEGGAEAGADRLLDPARRLTVIEKAFFFVPRPHNGTRTGRRRLSHPRGSPPGERSGRRAQTRCRSERASRRFERSGFTFQIADGKDSSATQTLTSVITKVISTL